jgi:hypothetical protein
MRRTETKVRCTLLSTEFSDFDSELRYWGALTLDSTKPGAPIAIPAPFPDSFAPPNDSDDAGARSHARDEGCDPEGDEEGNAGPKERA